MANIKGKNIRIEVASLYGPAVVISEISNAKPGVATATGHGLTAGACGYLTDMDGMVVLDGQAVRVKNPTVDTFELQGIDTTDLGDFNSGKFVPVTQWKTLAESTGKDTGGGASEKLDSTRLIDTISQQDQGNAAAQSVSIPVLSQDVNSEAGQVIEDAAFAGRAVVMRASILQTGALRLFRGEPGLPGESITRGQLATGTLDFAVKGRELKLPA